MEKGIKGHRKRKNKGTRSSDSEAKESGILPGSKRENKEREKEGRRGGFKERNQKEGANKGGSKRTRQNALRNENFMYSRLRKAALLSNFCRSDQEEH